MASPRTTPESNGMETSWAIDPSVGTEAGVHAWRIDVSQGAEAADGMTKAQLARVLDTKGLPAVVHEVISGPRVG